MFLLTLSSCGRRISAFFTSLRPRAELNDTLTILKHTINRRERNKHKKRIRPEVKSSSFSVRVRQSLSCCYDRKTRDTEGNNTTSGSRHNKSTAAGSDSPRFKSKTNFCVLKVLLQGLEPIPWSVHGLWFLARTNACYRDGVLKIGGTEVLTSSEPGIKLN